MYIIAKLTPLCSIAQNQHFNVKVEREYCGPHNQSLPFFIGRKFNCNYLTRGPKT